MDAAIVSGRTFLVVDDHRILAEALACTLLRHGAAGVEVAWSLGQARALLARDHPHVVLLDLWVGAESGLDLLPELPPGIPVVVISGSSPRHLVAQAVGLGVHAWIVKNGSTEDLFIGIATALSGGLYLSAAAVDSSAEFFSAGGEGKAGSAEVVGFASEISEREADVLACLVAGMDRAATARELEISPNTVRTHLQRLFRAADVHSILALQAAARACHVAPRPPRQRD